jgi:hypothetical protein
MGHTLQLAVEPILRGGISAGKGLPHRDLSPSAMGSKRSLAISLESRPAAVGHRPAPRRETLGRALARQPGRDQGRQQRSQQRGKREQTGHADHRPDRAHVQFWHVAQNIHAKNGKKQGPLELSFCFSIFLFSLNLSFSSLRNRPKAAQQNGSRHSDRHQRIRGHPMHYIAPDLYRLRAARGRNRWYTHCMCRCWRRWRAFWWEQPPGTGEALKPLGDLFIRLVKMVIAPVIFLTIVTGIAGCAIWDRSAAWRARPLPISSPFPRWR